MRAIDIERMKKYGLKADDFKPATLRKKDEKASADTFTDEIGNVYKQKINTDGIVTLKLVESYTGELFE